MKIPKKITSINLLYCRRSISFSYKFKKDKESKGLKIPNTWGKSFETRFLNNIKYHRIIYLYFVSMFICFYLYRRTQPAGGGITKD